jgi:hypothetical protein
VDLEFPHEQLIVQGLSVVLWGHRIILSIVEQLKCFQMVLRDISASGEGTDGKLTKDLGRCYKGKRQCLLFLISFRV